MVDHQCSRHTGKIILHVLDQIFTYYSQNIFEGNTYANMKRGRIYRYWSFSSGTASLFVTVRLSNAKINFPEKLNNMKLKIAILCLLLSKTYTGKVLVNDLRHYYFIYLISSELFSAP